jgi:acetolactate synthase I/II/III large subunit
MRVSDYIVQFLENKGIEQVFMVTGGGAMHLNDAFGRSKKLNVVFTHHEQSAAMAADAYFRLANKPAVLQVTTGPGGINALNGVYGAYVDSIPIIIISGQVRTNTLAYTVSSELRQFGDQEAKITEIVKTITKHSVLVQKVSDIPEVLKEAYNVALSGRPGPVWVDIPIDIQGADINEVPATEVKAVQNVDEVNEEDLTYVVNALRKANRPIFAVGNGVRFSDTVDILRKIGEHTKIPITTVWNSHDIIPNNHVSYCGRFGADGERAGNFAVQNADLLVILGARMHIRQVGFNHSSFARAAEKIMIDVDPIEMEKPTLNINKKIKCNLKDLMPRLERALGIYEFKQEHSDYNDWCKEKVRRFPVLLERHKSSSQTSHVNPYFFIDELFKKIPDQCNVVTSDGTAAVVTFKVAEISEQHRVFTNKGCASMGFELPAVVGAFFADPKKMLVCIAGDGSIMMNMQELQTIKHHCIPVKIFLLNNGGYHSIRQSQQNYFDGFSVGCGIESGLSFPDFQKLSHCFGFTYQRISSVVNLSDDIERSLKTKGAVLTEIIIDKDQLFEPRIASKKLANGDLVSNPLEDMSPLLTRKQLADEMIIDVWQD